MYRFEDILLNDEILFKYMIKCSKGVMWKNRVQQFISNPVVNIYKLKENLQDRNKWTNITGFIEEFTIFERGKVRLIQNISFPNRIIQKIICEEVLEPLLFPQLLKNNSASQNGKGVLYARNLCENHIRSLYDTSDNNSKLYALTLDFRNYFYNINIHKVFEQIKPLPIDNELKDFIWFLLEIHRNKESDGLHLGSQLSQIFALTFPMVEWDNYIFSHTPRFGRYMDDTYILSNDKQELLSLKAELEYKQLPKLGIEISRSSLHKLSNGFEFLKCKYILKSTGKIIKRMPSGTNHRIRRKVKGISKLSIDEQIIVLSSHIGYLKYFQHTDSRARDLLEELIDRDQYLRKLKKGEIT